MLNPQLDVQRDRTVRHAVSRATWLGTRLVSETVTLAKVVNAQHSVSSQYLHLEARRFKYLTVRNNGPRWKSHHLRLHYFFSSPSLSALLHEAPPSLQLFRPVAVVGRRPVELVALGQQEALQVLVLGPLLQPLLLQHGDELVPFLHRPHDLRQDLLLVLQLRGTLPCVCWRRADGRKGKDGETLPFYNARL